MKHSKELISIWFFVGVLLIVYGVIILASGIYQAMHPETVQVVLSELHIAIWWGALLFILGAVYSYLFYPGRRRR
jgi:low temperature requirement protein LtrA